MGDGAQKEAAVMASSTLRNSQQIQQPLDTNLQVSVLDEGGGGRLLNPTCGTGGGKMINPGGTGRIGNAGNMKESDLSSGTHRPRGRSK
nr:hypothetical protein [uncultured Rhodopila sp.]